MSKQSSQEKRLQTLKRQLYGGGDQQSRFSEKKAESSAFSAVPPKAVTKSDLASFSTGNISLATQSVSTKMENTSYLKNDLTKILILSSLAIATELILFFTTKNHLVNLNLHF